MEGHFQANIGMVLTSGLFLDIGLVDWKITDKAFHDLEIPPIDPVKHHFRMKRRFSHYRYIFLCGFLICFVIAFCVIFGKRGSNKETGKEYYLD